MFTTTYCNLRNAARSFYRNFYKGLLAILIFKHRSRSFLFFKDSQSSIMKKIHLFHLKININIFRVVPAASSLRARSSCYSDWSFNCHCLWSWNTRHSPLTPFCLFFSLLAVNPSGIYKLSFFCRFYFSSLSLRAFPSFRPACPPAFPALLYLDSQRPG